MPFSFRAIPQSGQRSMLLLTSYSCDAALTPLVKVSFAMLSLSLRRSYTIFIIPSTVIVSFVTTIRQFGYAVANSVLKASPFIVFCGAPFLMPCCSYTPKMAGNNGSSSLKIKAWSKFFKTFQAVFWISLQGKTIFTPVFTESSTSMVRTPVWPCKYCASPLKP